MSVSTEKSTPIECMENGYPMTDARQMQPDDLTKEDCRRLLEAEYPPYIIGKAYNIGSGDFYLKLRDWGLGKRTTANGKYPAKPVPKVPVRVIQEEVAPQTQQEVMGETEKQLTPADLTKDVARALLEAGYSKPEIAKRYHFGNPALVYAVLTKWGLHTPGSKKGQLVEAEMPHTATEEEKADIFGDSQSAVLPHTVPGYIEAMKDTPGYAASMAYLKNLEDVLVPKDDPVSRINELAHDQAIEAPSTIDLGSWDLVNYKQVQAHTVLLRIQSKGDGALVCTDLKDGDNVQFRLDPCADGKRVAVVKAETGRKLHLEKNTNVRLRFTSIDLTLALQKRGVALPAAYRLEWNEALGAYIGELVEKAGVA